MAISFNTGATNSASTTTSVTLGIPAGVLVNDVMLLIVEVFCQTGTTPTVSITGGGGSWTLVPMTTGTNPEVATAGSSIWNYGYAYYRVATAGDPGATITISESGSAGASTWLATAMAAYTGASTTSPIDVAAGNNAQATTTGTAPTVTTVSANDWAVYLAAAGLAGVSMTGPGTSREVVESAANIAAGINDSNSAIGAGTNIGGGTWSQSAGSANWWSLFTIGLAVAGAAAPPEKPTPHTLREHPLFQQILTAAAWRADIAPAVATPVPATWRLMDGANGRPGNGPGTATGAGTNVVGTSFYPNQSGMWLQGYWWWVAAAGGQSTSAQKFCLWSCVSGGGMVVPGSVVTSGTLSAGWNYIPLAQPVQLALYGQYTAATGLTGTFPQTAGQFNSGGPYQAGIVNGPLTAYSDANGTNPAPYTYGNGDITAGASSTDPTLPANQPGGDANAGTNFWLDVQVTNTPPAGYNGSYRLWPNMQDADSNTAPDSAVNYVVGTEIILSQPCVVNAIWYYRPSATTQFATSADIWRVRDGVRVATQGSPTWTTWGGGKAPSGGGQWVRCEMPGVTLPAGDYRVSVYDSNGSPDQWGAKRLGYWEAVTVASGGSGTPDGTFLHNPPGANGITNGPLYAPPTPLASATTDYSTGNSEPGQSVFAVGPPNQYPNTYVGQSSSGIYTGPALFQNYWVDVEVTPASTFTPDAPDLPQRIPHPLFHDLLEVAARRIDVGSGVTTSTWQGTATIIGAGVLTANVIQGAGASLTASGLVAASATQGAGASLAGTGTLASNIQQGSGGSFGGAGALSVNAIQQVIAALAGTGTLTANVIQGAGATLTGLGAVASNVIQGSGGSMGGAGTLSVNATQDVIAALTGAGTLSAVVIQGAGATLTGLGVVNTGSQGGGGSMSGSGAVSVNAIQGAGSPLTAAGLLAASVVQGAGLTAVASGLVTVSATELAGVTLTGLGVVTAAPAGGAKSALLLVFLP